MRAWSARGGCVVRERRQRMQTRRALVKGQVQHAHASAYVSRCSRRMRTASWRPTSRWKADTTRDRAVYVAQQAVVETQGRGVRRRARGRVRRGGAQRGGEGRRRRGQIEGHD